MVQSIKRSATCSPSTGNLSTPPRCYTFGKMTAGAPRTFKTARLSKAARKAPIADQELCDAIEQVLKRQCDDRG